MVPGLKSAGSAGMVRDNKYNKTLSYERNTIVGPAME